MVEQIVMRSEALEQKGLTMESIRPTSGLSFSEQLESCLVQVRDFISPAISPGYIVTQQSFFILAENREVYERRSSEIRKRIVEFDLDGPATAIIAQAPAGLQEVVLELICTRTGSDRTVEYKDFDGLPYTLVNYEDYRILHACGLMGSAGEGIAESARCAFLKALDILKAEGMELQSIVRQWNYVEDIAHVEESSESAQNYQVFNDIRADFYSRADFREGYPAATGIGMNTGGVIIGFIAVGPHGATEVKPIRNPRQIDAHSYSKKMLVGAETGITETKCTPKFERGKSVKLGDKSYIYVSGTASIVGEKSMHVDDVIAQTETTIDNIYGLFTREIQADLDLSFEVSDIVFSHLRVYVKHKKDIPAVEAICKKRLQCKSSLTLIADICREELLIEIEGMFTLGENFSYLSS